MHKDTFKGSLLGCFEYVPYTALTIVLIIKTMVMTDLLEDDGASVVVVGCRGQLGLRIMATLWFSVQHPALASD